MTVALEIVGVCLGQLVAAYISLWFYERGIRKSVPGWKRGDPRR